ncbi:MAG TPA: methyltetrahydrofolate cobalamin methyltransferase [Syntrophomonadaceae bacterium]|nr:methyltetrahydrofolate cobalamin methyltransferase [Syntrophomonadaceae bacterium]
MAFYMIGERINGMFKDIGEAVAKFDPKPIQEWAIKQTQAGAAYLDVNVGPTATDRVKSMRWMVEVIQEVCDTPIALDSTNYDAIEAGLEICKKPALINSCPCERPKIERVFPMAKKYGAKIVALTMDKSGIPKSADMRVAFAMELLAAADEFGLAPDDLFIDPLILPCNVAQDHAPEVLEALRQIKGLSDPPPHLTLGLSNVSQGTPHRPLINRTYCVMAMTVGLDSAIMDVNDDELVDAIATADMLLNKAIYCDSYAKVFRQR